MVRAAQQAGDIASLYPEGCTRVAQIPWFLQVAIEHALTVLNWLENLPKNEVPPRRIWADTEGLEQWWNKVEDLRSSDYPLTGASSSDEDGAGTENDLARAFKGR